MVVPPFPALLAGAFGNVIGLFEFLSYESPVVEAVLVDKFGDGLVFLNGGGVTSKFHDCRFI